MSVESTIEWRAVSASARGSSHSRTGAPNQDAVLTRVLDDPHAGVVVALADGHGGSRYVRSDVGARFAVEIGCEVGVAWASANIGVAKTEALASLERELPREIVTQWSGRVEADVVAHPLTDDELARLGDADNAMIAYGATLLVAIASGDRVALAQLGDGDITAVVEHNALTPIPGDDRLVGGQTTSLCLQGAENDFRFAMFEGTRCPNLVLLSSDGYGNSFANVDWRAIAARDVAEQVQAFGLDGVERALPSWIAESAEAGGDDVTVAVVAREGHAAGGRTRANDGRWLVTSVVAAIALLIGAASGWLLGHRSSSHAVSAPSTTGVTAIRPTTSTTVVVSKNTHATGLPAAATMSISAPSGTTVAFVVNMSNPAPEIASVPAGGSVTRVLINGVTWRVQDGRLQRVNATGSVSSVDTTPTRIAALQVAGGVVWAINDPPTTLIAIDPTNVAVVKHFAIGTSIGDSTPGSTPTSVVSDNAAP